MKSLMTKMLLSKSLILLLLFASTIQAQNYKMENSSEIKVEGTSNIHDWDMTASSKTGSAVIETKDGKLTGIRTLTVTLPAESLKSGKSGMDKNTYKALKTNKNKNIEFSLDQVKKIQENGSNSYKVNGIGTLKIAGVSKQVPIDFTANLKEEKLQIEGAKTLNMTDFKVDPPTAMMGTIKTGEEVTIKFKTNFSNNQSL